MQASLAELLHDWHDFYLLVGTASATLVGLMFVSASIGANVYNESHRNAMRAFVTPTVVHFSAALLICILVTMPSHTWITLSGLLGAGGAVGLLYSGRILFALLIRHKFEVDLSDRLFYVLIPVLGYVVVVVAAVMLLLRSSASPSVLAAAMLVLLLAGIRNAWDMTIWVMLKTPNSGRPPL